ncbi:MAG: endonuclease domain-containing protein [Bacillota bacterium]
MSYENSNISKERSRYLRKHQTFFESLIWRYYLKDSDWKFRRQHVIGGFIVDFYCIKLQLAIEIDGVHHHDEEKEAYDARRTVFLESKGVRVLRIDNAVIQYEFDVAVSMIEEEIKDILKCNL